MERHEPLVSSPSRDDLHARRAAAARRRAVLTVGLFIATIAAGAAVAVATAPVWLIAIPLVLLISVLVLGRKAAVANARHDEAYRRATEHHTVRGVGQAPRRAGRPAPAVRAQVTGRAVYPSQTHTEMISRVAERGANAPAPAPAKRKPSAKKAPAAPLATSEDVVEADATEVADGATILTTADVTDAAADVAVEKQAEATEEWAPVAVPRPVYAMKAAAPRWEPAPLTAELRQLTESRRAELAGDSIEAPAEQPEAVAEEASEDSLGVNLNSVLARRRVAGE